MFHAIGAMFALIFGGLNMIVTGNALGKIKELRVYRVISVLMGITTLVAFVVTLSGIYDASISGVVERIAIYPVIIWPTLTGVVLTIKSNLK